MYQLAALRPLCERVVVVSNSALDAPALARVETLADGVILRENVGFDFAAWREGLASIGWDELAGFDSVTLMNDTCFGPVGDLGEVFATMEAHGCDFWGVTNHRATPAVPLGGVPTDVPEHLQSYFVSYARSAVQHPVFREFWESVPDYTDVNDVVRNLEIRATARFAKAGLRYRAVFDTVDEDYAPAPWPDFSYSLPDRMLAAGAPLLKVKSFLTRPEFAPFALAHMQARGYPARLAAAHLSQIDRPDRTGYLAAKQGDYSHDTAAPSPGLRVVVHLHVHYVDLLAELLDALDALTFDHALIATTDDADKVAQIEAAFAGRGRVGEVVVVPPRGRDIYPLMLIADRLREYDVVGHFHTKKSVGDKPFVGEAWRHELMDMLMAPGSAIVADLEANPSLGVVIADMPMYFRYNKIVTADNEALMAPQMNELWRRMGMEREIDFRSRDTFVMSYGTFFWARRDAIAPLLALELEGEIPPEPLGVNTILHCLERMLVYVAWGRGYDFRIAQGRYVTPFVDSGVLNLHTPSPVAAIVSIPPSARSRLARYVPRRVADLLRRMLR
ncbi:rhamnan synthesis F family protein [Xylanimonas ulmi]|uniref:rhamnan synthesis F family protein n=1 Tax=Xylanimonas ulmi TaxID=228973 RepID=UPI0013EEDF88|nr:rhamnan synthesis F family protein [Xylanibacterium ulmi]